MKNLLQYLLEYKQRMERSFNYELIKEKIKNCKPTFFGQNVCIEALWKPQIYFDYKRGWSAGKPDKEFFHGEDYKGITLGTSTIMYIDFYAEKKLFKENIIEGKIVFWHGDDEFNDDEKKNWKKVTDYIKSKFNAKFSDGNEYIAFKTYEELEEILKGLEKVINEYNINYDKNNAAYLYFNKDEATSNAADKKKQYEILTYEEEIVKLNKELEETKKAAAASDTDLSAIIDMINDKIEYFKKKKDEMK